MDKSVLEALPMQDADVSLREAREDDLPKLEWFGVYTHYRHVYRRTFTDRRRLMLVADFHDFPIGQVFVYFVGKRRPIARRRIGYLYALRVMTPFQGHGIGTRLIHEAEARLQARDCRWAVIAAAKENIRARQLYERLGYEVYGDDPGRWQYTDHEGRVRDVVEPAWMLRKRL